MKVAIASVTGASLVLVVTEPTLSGLHDLERVLALTRHFGVGALVAVNKWDVNAEVTERIEARAREMGAQPAGRIRYDEAATRAQLEALSVVEYGGDGAADDVRRLWERVRTSLASVEDR